MLEDMMLRVRHYSMMRVRNAHRARGDAVVRGARMLMHEENLVLSRGDRDCGFYDSSFIFYMIIFDCARAQKPPQKGTKTSGPKINNSADGPIVTASAS